MTTAIERILSTRLIVEIRGALKLPNVRVAADNHHVATISAGMNDRDEYARLFAAAPDLLKAIKPLACSSEDYPPPDIEAGAWRLAVLDARKAYNRACGRRDK